MTEKSSGTIVACRAFIIAALIAAIAIGYAKGREHGLEQGHYEAWHEADTWAENVHHACMEQARNTP